MKEFRFHPTLERALTQAGLVTPTPIQRQAIPIGLSGRDLIGTAQTGTGKTAAFVLPILQQLLDDRSKLGRTRALVITPTRELAEQIHSVIRQLSQGTQIRSATVYGGVGMGPQVQAFRNGIEILVACPGRLLDHLAQGATLSNIDTLVLDEADRLLDMGFLPDVRRILRHLPTERQTMLFSATFAPELQKLVNEVLRNPERVDAGSNTVIKTVAHALYPVPQHLKTPLLIRLLEDANTGSVLVFTRTKHRANRLTQHLMRVGHATAVLHANKSQNQRQIALDRFRSGDARILVATDIAARGLDIASVTHVINYDIPDTVENYIHRIGRTGRAEREGDALTLVTNEDAQGCREIERALKAPLERRTIADFDYNAPAPAQQNERDFGQQQRGRGTRPATQREQTRERQPAQAAERRPQGARPGTSEQRNQGPRQQAPRPMNAEQRGQGPRPANGQPRQQAARPASGDRRQQSVQPITPVQERSEGKAPRRERPVRQGA